jgi:hypothetical protein
MTTLRKILHLLFQVLLVLCLANYRYLAWKESLLLFFTGIAAAVSYSRYGRIMLVPGGRFGISVMHLLFFIALFFMTAFPVALGPGLASWKAFPPPLGLDVTVLICAAGLCVLLLGFVGKKVPRAGGEGDENGGETGEFMVAILLTLIVAGAITIGAEWLFLPGNVRGVRMDSRFLVVAANSVVLLFVCARVFLDPADSRPPGISGRIVVSDYRPAFIALLMLLSAWGFYGTGRVLLAEWEAGKAYGARDYERAETALRTLESYNSVLRFGALERRTLERLGELYLSTGRNKEASDCFKKMLSVDPTDVLATVKMIQIEASRGDFKGASALFEGAELLPSDIKGIRRLDTLLECCPSYVDGQYRLGLLFMKHGEVGRAAGKFAAVTRYQPSNMMALERYAELMEKRGDGAAAAEARGRMAFSTDAWEIGGGVLKPLADDFIKVELSPGLWNLTFEVTASMPVDSTPRIKVRLEDSPASEVIVGPGSPGNGTAAIRTGKWGAQAVHFLLVFDRPSATPPDGPPFTVSIRNVRFTWAGK